jgi:hypothetical protein
MCSYTRVMAVHALAGMPSLPSAFPTTDIVPGSASRPVPGLFPAVRVLPVLPELTGLFPGGGLPLGGTILLGPARAPEVLVGAGFGAPGPSSALSNRVSGLTSLLLLLLAGASSRGHWCAVAGLPELGLVAAVELGADLDHLVLIPCPGSEGRWQSVVTTLLETVDLVCLVPDAPVRPADARRLSTRARERRSTLVVLDAASPTGVARGCPSDGQVRAGRIVARWPGPSDLRCSVKESSWSGLEHGHGLLSFRQLEAEVGGRGAASRPKSSRLRLPA